LDTTFDFGWLKLRVFPVAAVAGRWAMDSVEALLRLGCEDERATSVRKSSSSKVIE
jgi:hypothetical protein